MEQNRLDVFQVIADPSRRQILHLLSKDSRTINSLAENFDMSRPAVSKHIKVLYNAGFIAIQDIGRERHCILKQDGFKELKAWLAYYDKFWGDKLDKLGALMNDKVNKKMKDQDLTITISVNQTPKEAFDAINNVRGWWSEEVKGGTEKLNDEFTYKARHLHRCTMKLTEVIPYQKVVWHVLDNYFSFTQDQTEWQNTKIVFEISEKDGKTQVRFTHQGLVPQHECYEVCSNAWTGYITGSLYNLITTGKGEPNPKES